MEKLLELYYIKDCYLNHSKRFRFTKRYLNKRLKELNTEIRKEELKCGINHQ